MIDEAQVKNIVRKALDEEHLTGFIKKFEKEHNLFRGSHDKIGLPENLEIHQTIINYIINKIEDDSITLDQIGDGTAYGRIVLAALSEGKALLSEAVGDLDDISDGVYAKMLATSLSEGKALLSEALGSLDSIANGETYGRILLADLSGGHILLATCDGDLDDVDDGSSYGKILLTDISAGHILLASCDGDLDDVGEGTTYGKVLVTSLSAGKILLTEAEGDLDDIGEGTNYGKVAITDISAGHILLATCDGDLDDVDDGTYGKVLSTDISSGHIKLTECEGTLDSIANGATYGRVALTDISAGHILLASTVGDLDDVDDGTSWGKVALTDISSGHILLATCDGDLDDVGDGTNYGKVAVTSISAGKIVIAGMADDALAQMFTDGDAKDYIEAWMHGVDATLIDGGKIYTGSILAAQIAAGAITADKINVGDFIYLPSDENLVGYWSFDEGSGTLAVDGSGNGNDGSLENMAEGDWIAGVVGTGLEFDGVDGNNNHIDCGSFAVSGAFSMVACVKPDVTNAVSRGIIGNHYHSAPCYGACMLQNGTSVRIDAGDGAGNRPNHTWTNILTAGVKTFLVAVYDGSKFLLYVDGVKQAYEWTATVAQNSTKWIIGQWASTYLAHYIFDGLIDEVRVYNCALAESEAKGLYLYPAGNKVRIISGVQIADDTVTAAKIVAGTITADEIEARSITADRIALGAITADEIAAGAITADEIAGSTITADEIFANTITVGEVKLGTILLEMYTDFYSAGLTSNDPWVGAIFGGVIGAVAGAPNHPGIIRLGGDATNAGARFMTATNCISIAGDEHSEFVFEVTTILPNIRVRLGFQDSITATLPTDGVYIDITGSDLTGKTRNNGAGSTTSSYTISNNTWYRAKIAMNSDATLITFTLCSEAGSELWSQTLAANIPTGAGRETGHGAVMFVAANVARTVDIDLMIMTFAGDLTR